MNEESVINNYLPLDRKTLDEAVQRAGEYAYPKRNIEIKYILKCVASLLAIIQDAYDECETNEAEYCAPVLNQDLLARIDLFLPKDHERW